MLFKNDKKILKIIRKAELYKSGYYLVDEIWFQVKNKYKSIGKEKFVAGLDALEEDGFITMTQDRKSFRMNSRGQYYYSYCRKMLLHYIAEKWIDFFALAIATGALVVSIISLMLSLR